MKIIIDISDLTYESIMKSKVLKYVGADFIRNGKPLPDNATNGDMIKAMFPNLKTGANPYIPSVDIYVGGILMMRVDRNWWNAPYKKENDE